MAHVIVEEADKILDKEFKVLNHGFVRLVDYMGSDESIVQAARVSYGKGTKKVSEDRGLIRYLMRHRHTTPFEMVEFKFHVKLPIFIARQWIRHRTASVNEYSGRYSVLTDEFYFPNPDDVRTQSEVNKQGRSDKTVPENVQREFLEYLKNSADDTYATYQKYIEAGLARELARISLPLSVYTEWYWKIDLHNLFHFLRLRSDPHAQQEFREYARVMTDMVKTVCPMAYEAYEDYILNAVAFSGPEIKVLAGLLPDKELTPEDLVSAGLSKREAREFLDKLHKVK